MEYAIFTLVVVGAFAGLHGWMRRSGREERPPYFLWLAVLCLLATGWFYTEANVFGAIASLIIFLGASSTIIALLRADLRHRELAQERNQLNSQLEERVAERTAELEATHRKLVDASRQAGMAEVATGVLHNVGNVLNSVNVASSLVTERIRKSKLGSFNKVAEVIRAHQDDLAEFLSSDPQGKQMPEYITKLAERLADEQRFLLSELETLRKNIDHIKQVVALQQGCARASTHRETISAAELIEDALQINRTGLDRHRVRVVREYADVPAVHVDKHRVLQILINLINNAKYALDESAHSDHRLTLRVCGGEGGVRIQVADNGAGIAPENLARVFTHGFTTKKDGHGFGLHSGAAAARETGGTLTVQSDGLGHGATFTLELPLAVAESEAAAENPFNADSQCVSEEELAPVA